jgi:uncharacterized repeat protein (TIGR01451 family)
MKTTAYRCGGLFALCAGALVPPAHGVGTRSGSTIANIASVDFSQGGSHLVVQSNTARFRVDEVLNVVVQGNDAGRVTVASPDTRRVLVFTVTNLGNGPEAFRLAANAAIPGSRFDPTIAKIALDTNGNQRYDPDADVDYVAGSNDPVLQPDQSITVFVIGDIPSGGANGDVGFVALNANAIAGIGAPGTLLAGRGAGGSDIVIGSSRGTAIAQGGFLVTRLSVQLAKSQSTATSPQSGSVVTYSLALDLAGGGGVVNGVITDPIPQHTSYVPGSLRLDGLALSDQADADTGRFTGSAIEVRLGALSAPASHVVSFQVRLD